MDWGSGADVSSGFESFRARWESKTRWYEVEFSEDLFGTWLLTRRWGGAGFGAQWLDAGVASVPLGGSRST